MEDFSPTFFPIDDQTAHKACGDVVFPHQKAITPPGNIPSNPPRLHSSQWSLVVEPPRLTRGQFNKHSNKSESKQLELMDATLLNLENSRFTLEANRPDSKLLFIR